MQRWICCALLCACSAPASVRKEPPAPPPSIVVELPETHIEVAIEPVPVRVVETLSATQAAGYPPSPYRDGRYVARCRRESRRDAPQAERIESKRQARHRGRQEARRGQLDELLIFARIVHGETGTPRPGFNDDPRTPLWDEAEAFLAVLDGRRGAMSRAEMFVNYSPRRLYPHPGDVRQQWIAELQLDGSRPPSWPRPRQRRFHPHPSWRAYGCPRWLATIDRIRPVLRAYREARVGRGPCEEQPDHWGGAPGVDDHPLRLGWRRVDCGTTRNRFWVVPDEEEEAPTLVTLAM